MEYFFQTNRITVGYHGIPLIRNINIGMQKGEILTLIGPNGAGKTTILRSIAGQLALLGGVVMLEGEALNHLSERELAGKLSIVLTERIRPELMTCREVVEMGRYPYTGLLGILSEEDKTIVRKTMEMTGVSMLAEKEFLKVSDGERQRVMLARAIAQEPDILVLDEPVSFLDIRCKLEFLSILQEMARKKKLTVIMSLHELDLAEKVSDKVLCVKGEYMERFGTPEEVFDREYIDCLYGMDKCSFDERSGSSELQKTGGKPEVFVIAGGGKGIFTYRSLQRKGIPFSTGILWENDLDIPVAAALAVKVIKEKAFRNIRPELVEEAGREIDQCNTVICCLEEFGELNREMESLKEYAIKQGKLEA